MKNFLASIICLLMYLSLSSVWVGAQDHASIPPRGWNSYDSFCWTISEEEFLQNAEIVSKRLRPHGYEYVVVDYLWYRRKVPGASVDSLGYDVIDEWGRMQPDPQRWPSSRGGKGFAEVAHKVHRMGLKFGIHVMRGISTQAFNANTPVLDTGTGRAYEESGKQWRARDIGLKEKACAWMPHGFMSVNVNSGAGQAFLRSLYQQYAEWGVDFIKHDCVFGADLEMDEISSVSGILKELRQPIYYSLSPGTSVTPAMAKDVSGLANMYRITGDDWDTWGDLASHFDVSRDMAASNMIGAKGLLGKSWPDLDMLPLGWLTDPGSNQGPHRNSRLTLEEQKTQVTLWAMAKSPLMFGGDVRKLDDTTFKLLTNPILLEINSFSSNNKEIPYVARMRTPDRKPVVGLTSCTEPRTNAWRQDNHGQICWGENSDSEQFCLYNKKALLSSDEKSNHLEKVNLIVGEGTELCLGGSHRQKLTSQELKGVPVSPCRREPNLMWELHSNGSVRNTYSGLCAVLKSVKGSGGIRSWIATGIKGEVYVAFFNLEHQRSVVSAKISDLLKAVPGRINGGVACETQEVWSGKELGVKEGTISTVVEAHGCALFVLNCNKAARIKA